MECAIKGNKFIQRCQGPLVIKVGTMQSQSQIDGYRERWGNHYNKGVSKR